MPHTKDGQDDGATRSMTRRAMVLAAAWALGVAFPAGTALAQASSRSVSPAEWAKIVEAARKEGKVVVYATMGPAVHDRIVEAFNANNPGIIERCGHLHFSKKSSLQSP